jgi:hypothetical protein
MLHVDQDVFALEFSLKPARTGGAGFPSERPDPPGFKFRRQSNALMIAATVIQQQARRVCSLRARLSDGADPTGFLPLRNGR